MPQEAIVTRTEYWELASQPLLKIYTPLIDLLANSKVLISVSADKNLQPAIHVPGIYCQKQNLEYYQEIG